MAAPLTSLAVSAAASAAKGLVQGFARAEAAKPEASDAASKDKALKAAKDFEAMFLEQTLDRVFSSAGEDGPLGENGTGGSVYRSMLVKEYAGGIVKSGGIGISNQVYAEMLRLQEGRHAQRS